MSNHIAIRRATPADADIIARFNIAMAAETEDRALDADVVGRGVRRGLADESLGVYHVAEWDGAVVGQMLITTEFSDWRDGLFWWIQSVYVAPEARGGGVYRALHEHVARLVQDTPGVCGLRLYVDADNRTAQEVYRRMGMVETDYRLYETDLSGGA